MTKFRLAGPAALGAGLVLGLAGAPGEPARAAMSVIDGQNLAKNSQILSTVKKQQTQISDMLGLIRTMMTEMQGLHGGHGSKGKIVGLLARLLDFGGPADAIGVSSHLGPLVPSLGHVVEAVAEQGGEAGEAADFSTLEGARAFAETALTPGDAEDRKDLLAVAARRDAVYRESLQVALATGLHQRDSAARAPDRLAQLAERAAAAETAREQAAVQTAVLLALLDEMAASRGLAAARLTMEAADRIRRSPIGTAANENEAPALSTSQNILFTPPKGN